MLLSLLFNRRSNSNSRQGWLTMVKTLGRHDTKTLDPSMLPASFSSMKNRRKVPLNMASVCSFSRGSKHNKDLSSRTQPNSSSNTENNNRCSSNNSSNSSISSSFISSSNNMYKILTNSSGTTSSNQRILSNSIIFLSSTNSSIIH